MKTLTPEYKLELCRKIAEIELKALNLDHENEGCAEPTYTAPKEYNPFDWSLLGPLMVKYKVDIDHDMEKAGGEVHAWGRGHMGTLTILGCCEFDSDEELPQAILECIIESQPC